MKNKTGRGKSLFGRHLQRSSLSQHDIWYSHRSRIDYYEYLAILLQGSQGHDTLQEIFMRDAERHGLGSPRGRLSRHWAQWHPVTGGDLQATWQSCFPAQELQLIRVAQQAGNQALTAVLGHLVEMLRLLARTRGWMLGMLVSAGVSVLLTLVVLAAVPLLTVPRLQTVFQDLPVDHYGRLTQSLWALAAWLEWGWLLISASLLAIGAWVMWSFSHFVGAGRPVLDRLLWWRVYRQLQSLRFLALLEVMLSTQAVTSIQLRTAIQAQMPGAAPWLHWHLVRMLHRIDQGKTGADSLDTGLLDPAVYWLLCDMVRAQGLVQGLRTVRLRIAQRGLVTIQRQVGLLKWVGLLGGVAFVLAMGLWHYAVIDELRQALVWYYSSQ